MRRSKSRVHRPRPRPFAAEIGAAEAMVNVMPGPARFGTFATDRAPSFVPKSPPPGNVRLAALAARLELRAGASEVERNSAEIDVMRAMFRPMAAVRVGPASTMAEGSGAMIMIGISITIWRERLRAGVAEAQAMQSMARADLEAMRRMVEGEAVAAREGVNAARARAGALRQEVVPRARMAVEASLAAYSAGRSTLVSVIEASRTLWDTRIELLMSDTALSSAWARLERATANEGKALR